MYVDMDKDWKTMLRNKIVIAKIMDAFCVSISFNAAVIH